MSPRVGWREGEGGGTWVERGSDFPSFPTPSPLFIPFPSFLSPPPPAPHLSFLSPLPSSLSISPRPFPLLPRLSRSSPSIQGTLRAEKPLLFDSKTTRDPGESITRRRRLRRPSIPFAKFLVSLCRSTEYKRLASACPNLPSFAVARPA